MNITAQPPTLAALQHRRAAVDITLNPTDLLQPEDAALVLGVSARTLAAWRSTGRYALPFIRCGARIRYRRADLAAWLQSRLYPGATAPMKGAA